VSISAPFIARPVATSLLAVAILCLGILGYRGLPVSSLPQVDFPTITVTTRLPGANPETTAALVTAPLERQLGQIPALSVMTSTSAFGQSQITLQFDLSRDIDGAAQDVQAAINAAASVLPRTLPYPPVYAKVNPADTPIMTLALTSPTLPLRELSDFADSLLSQRLAEVQGVGSVSVQGNLKPAVRVRANLEALAAVRLTLEDLRQAVSAANISAPKGSLDGPKQAYAIAANDQITSAREYSQITLAWRNGAPVRLADVAQVSDGFENERIGAWHQGQPAVVVDIRRQPGANIVGTVERIHEELAKARRALPADVKLSVVSDRTGTIRASIFDVQMTLALSVALVVLVVLLFLRTWSATLIAGVALPLSLIATFAIMWLAGFSLDNLSLMALTIGTGFIVDDAIVMIENIARHREEGASPLEAAYKGASEIGFTIVSLTASLLAVFIPLLFMSGIVGRMFREFALTLSIAVVVSAVISLTLTPMMCARLLRGTAEGGGRSDAGQRRSLAARLGDGLASGYASSLAIILRHRALTLLVTLFTLGLTVSLYGLMPKSFLPPQDTGLITVVVKADPDVSFPEMRRLSGEATQAISGFAEIADVVSVVGAGQVNPTSNVATLTVTLKPHRERRQTAAGIARRIEDALGGIPGVIAFAKPVQDVQIATRASFSQFQYTLMGTDGAEVRQAGARLIQALRADTRFRNISSVEEDEGLAATIVVDRVRAGQFGVSLQSVSEVLNSAFSQRQISTIYGQANQYRVVLEVEPRFRTDPGALGALRVPGFNASQIATATGTLSAPQQPVQVPLSTVARIERGTAPLAEGRQDQFPAFTIGFDLAPGQSLDEALTAIRAAETGLGQPEAISGTFAGEAAEFRASLQSQPLLILAAVIAIYIVLGVLYESFVHPITILSTLPSAGIGALIALLLVGEHLTVIGVIGIILLMGIVKKNAILMIDFAIAAERERGLSPEAAIVEACRLRFRPIMMTTLAALFGALPLALASGPGAELRMPLGVSIIGGLMLSQVLTLYTTPVIYLYLDAARRRLLGRGASSAGTAPEPSRPGSAP
jgi:multidrug efflux pump